MKNIETIYAYGDYVMKAEIEEKPEDIHLCVGYTDHGDEFIYVRTKNGNAYIYGYWCNRNYEPDYDRLLEHPSKDYVRLPKLFKNLDKGSQLSNSIYHDMDYYIDYSNYRSKSWDPASSKWSREYKFESVVETFQRAAASGIKYDWEDKRNILFEYLRKYDMDSPDNLKIVEELPMSSRIDGFDGVAAKKTCERETLYFDDLNFVIKDGVELRKDQITVLEDSDSGDEWGFYTSYLLLDQFEDGAEDRIRKECETHVNKALAELIILSGRLSTMNLKELVYARDMLSELRFNYYVPEYEEDQDED